MPTLLLAHVTAPDASRWWTAWTLDITALALVAVATTLYLRGAKLRARTSDRQARRTAALLAGACVILFAHVSPLASLAGVLLSTHMIQHLLLVLVAAPLLAWSAPVATVRIGLPHRWRHRLLSVARLTRHARQALGDPPPIALATAAHIAVLWAWHVPALYAAAVTHPGLHLIEHATFLGTAVWFWSEVWSTARPSRRQRALATLCIGAMIVQGGVLGALITFARRPLFGVYDGWGSLSALEDQQLAGAIMWVPPGFVYGTAAAFALLTWLSIADRAQRERGGSMDRGSRSSR